MIRKNTKNAALQTLDPLPAAVLSETEEFENIFGSLSVTPTPSVPEPAVAVALEPEPMVPPIAAEASTPIVSPTVPQPDANGEFATPADGAKWMAAMGIPQTPLRGKRPFLKDWHDKATTDFARIDAWYAEYNCNFGSVMKAVVGGYYAIETDSAKPRAEFRKENNSDFSARLVIKSGPGRAHWYYQHDPESLAVLANIGQTTDDGFSLRLNNEQCVSPGSNHPERKTQYAILLNNGAPAAATPQEIAWLKSKKKDEAIKPVSASMDGPLIPFRRHDIELTRIAGKLRNAGMEEETLAAALIEICEKRCENYGQDYKEMCEKIAHSICKKPVGADDTVYFGDRPAGTNSPNQESTSKPADAIGMTENGIPIFDYPKGEDESFEEIVSIAALEGNGDVTVEYPDPGTDDLVSLFAMQLASGTSLPLAFIRETLKNMTNQLIDGYYMHPVYPNLSLRGFHFNYGPSWVGKTTAFDLVMGWMKNEFGKRHIWMRDLLSYGSRQFLIRMLSKEVPLDKEGKPKWKAGNPFQLLHVKEGNRIAADGSDKYFRSIFSLLTDLYDQKEASTGSFSNDEWTAKDVEISSIINITPTDFKLLFEGKGSIGGGSLPRWTVSAPPKVENKKDWDKMPTDKLWATFDLLRARLPLVAERMLASDPVIVTSQPVILKEEEGAKEIRLAVHNKMEEAGRMGVRLTEYFVREQVNRAAFSIVHRNIMARADAERIAAWADAQMAARAIWPIDAGNPVERHEVTIRRTVMPRHLVTETKLKDACHYYRPGSGGVWAFETALNNMLNEIKCVGVAGKRRTPVFCPRWCTKHPRVRIIR